MQSTPYRTHQTGEALHGEIRLCRNQAWLCEKRSTAVSRFKDLKGDLAIRPIFHQEERRVEAHIFVAFLAYCLHVTFKYQLKQCAPGLTVHQALDVHLPTTDGRELIFTRYTQPETDQLLMLAQLGWRLPAKASPRISAKNTASM
jgi:hypothetical protein